MATLVQTQYDKILPFYHNNYTFAIVNGKVGLIDLEGNPLTEFIYDDLSDDYLNSKENSWLVYRNACSITLNGKWGLLDNKGNIVLDFTYDKPIQVQHHFDCDNIFYVQIGNKFALYNSDWKQVTTKLYDKIFFVHNGIIYSENRKSGIMDYSGNITHEAQYEMIYHHLFAFGDIFVCIQDGLYGIIKSNGDVIIEPSLGKLNWFSKSGKYISAKKRNCDKWGVLDIYNKRVVLEFKYDKIEFCTSDNNCEYVLTELDGKNKLYKLGKFENKNCNGKE